MIRNLIFDMDGVLLDSEVCIREASIKMLEQYGVRASHEDFIPFTGMGENRFIGGVAEKHGIAFKPEMKAQAYQLYEQLADRYVVVYEGVADMIVRLKTGGYRVAVASAADETKVLINLRCMGLEQALFDAIVTGSEVANLKPHPDIFLEAAKRIGAEPHESMVIEDAVAGCEAARAAGMRCAGVATATFDPQQLRDAGAEWILDKTTELQGLLETIS